MEGSTPRGRWSTPLLTALISAAAAVAGGYVGGATANDGAKTLQEQEVRRAQQLEHDQAVGATRLLIGELLLVRENVLKAGELRSWTNRDYHIDVPADHLQLLAVSLGSEAWRVLQNCLLDSARIPHARADSFNRSPAKSEDMTLVAETSADIRKAIGPLQALARLPGPPELIAPAANVRIYAKRHGILRP